MEKRLRSCSESPQRLVFDDQQDIAAAPDLRQTTLMDLDDESLLKILDCIPQVQDIVCVGAVNTRFNKLHFMVRRINADITFNPRFKKQYREDHLYSFLKGVALKAGGFLQQVTVFIDNSHQAPDEPVPAFLLDWINPISTSLQRLNLCCSKPILSEGFFREVACCTKLVSLEIHSMGNCSILSIRGAGLQRILEACSKLKVLDLEGDFVRGDSLELASKSLEKLCLNIPSSSVYPDEFPGPVSLSLETPALSELRATVDIGKLSLRLHSLKSVTLGKVREIEVASASPLVNLEYLSAADGNRSGRLPTALTQVMRNISDRRLDTLEVSLSSVPVFVLPTIFPANLNKVKHIVFLLHSLRTPTFDDPAPTKAFGLEVEQITVVITKYFQEREIEPVGYIRFYHLIMMLQRSFPLVRRICIRDNRVMQQIAGNGIWRAWQQLRDKFPDLIIDDPPRSPIRGSVT